METSKFPLTVDGNRLDKLCYNIKTISSRRRMSSRRVRDVFIPGRDGEDPTLNDDFESNFLALQMWIRGSDEDGNGRSRILYDKNVDELFRIFGKNNELLDIRQVMDPDRVDERINFARNPRLSKSSGSTVVRTNYAKNPGMKSWSGTADVRTNLITNPTMGAAGQITNWTGPAGVGRAWVPYGTSGGWGQATFNSGTLFEVYSPTFNVTAGLPYAAMAAMRNVSGAIRGRLGFVWYTGGFGTGTPTFVYGPSTEPLNINQWTWLDFVSTVPAGNVSARLIVSSDVSFIGGLQFYWDQTIVEQRDFTSTYFDGSNPEPSPNEGYPYDYVWTGAIDNSTSAQRITVPKNWSGLPTTDVRGMQDKNGSFVWDPITLRQESFAVIPAESTVMWMGGRPLTSSGQTWSGRIWSRAEVGSIGTVIRIGLFSFDGSSHTPVVTKEVTLTGEWQEIKIENAVMPVGTTEVGWRAQNIEEWPFGNIIYFDAATLENVAIPGPFFAGGMPNVVWTGTVHDSTSTELGGTVTNWIGQRGTLIKTYAFPQDPPFEINSAARYTATDVSVVNGNYIQNDAVLFNSHSSLGDNRSYTGSVWVSGPGRASIQILIQQGSTLLWSEAGEQVLVDGGWTRISFTGNVPVLVGADRVILRVNFYGFSGQPLVSDEFFTVGAMIEVSPTVNEWFDAQFPGATLLNSYSRQLPEIRRIFGKVTDAIDTEMFGPLGADLAVSIKLPYVFWEDLDDLIWMSDLVGGAGTTVQFEISNLRGSTAPINDAVIIVNGPATNPRVTNPSNGAYIQLNATLSSGQAWRIDVGKYKSGTGPKSLDWDSPAWTDQMWRTFYTGSRTRLLTLDPEGPEGSVYITLANCDSARIRAGRKFH